MVLKRFKLRAWVKSLFTRKRKKATADNHNKDHQHTDLKKDKKDK